MVEISEELVRGIASICGHHGACGRALKDAERRRAAGETVAFYKDERGSIIVRGTSATTHQPAAHASDKGGE